MRQASRVRFAIVFALAIAGLTGWAGRAAALGIDPASGQRGEDCHASFAVYLAAQPYIVNPADPTRREAQIVAIFEHAAGETFGAVVQRLEIVEVVSGRVVHSTAAGGDLDAGLQLESLFTWNGVDDSGAAVADGEYAVRVAARLYPGELWNAEGHWARRESIDANGILEDGFAGLIAEGSEIRLIIDRAGVYDHLFDRVAASRVEAQRAPLDSGFPFQYFYGSTHAHTNWSDGGMPASTACTSGRYGYVGGAQPADAFSYARTTGSLDYLAVVEHNHLMQEACSGCSAAQVTSRYTAGFQAAQTATVANTFVGLFGMEWGVISGGGHLNIYNQSQLFAWTGEPGHVFTTKSNYPELYTALAANQGTYGSYATFNHPNSTDFGSWTRSASGDAVMRGLSVISGPAFSTSTSFAPGGTRYTGNYNQALAYGWKIGPEAHQDNHCWNYGNSTPNRTGVLIPTGTTFDQQSLMAAYGARRFFAAEDRDVQLVYKTSDGARVMGDSFSATAAVAMSIAMLDPASEGVQKIELWGGRSGTNAAPGAAAAIQASNTGVTSLAANVAARTAGETWYYYVIAVQADGNMVWSAPMWITWGTGCTLPGTPALSAPAAGATGVSTAPVLSWGTVSGATSYDVSFGTAATPPFYQNVSGTSLAISGLANSTTYNWKVAAKSACGTGAASATRSFTTAGGGPVVTPIACGQSLAGTLATSDPFSTVRTTSYADTYSTAATAGSALTITLNATAFDAWLVLKNPAGTVVAQDDDGNGGTNSKIVYTPSSSGTYTIEATSYSAAATGAYTIALACASAPVTLISEGAESGATGWTYPKNNGSGWSIETSTASRTGAKRFKTNAGYTTYLDGADWSLVSPTFSLAGKTSATLKYGFMHKTESGYDYLRVEISINGGTSWTQLTQASGQSSGWTAWAPLATASLNSYAGNSNCKIRFRLTSDGSITDWGATIDDIEVTAQ